MGSRAQQTCTSDPPGLGQNLAAALAPTHVSLFSLSLASCPGLRGKVRGGWVEGILLLRARNTASGGYQSTGSPSRHGESTDGSAASPGASLCQETHGKQFQVMYTSPRGIPSRKGKPTQRSATQASEHGPDPGGAAPVRPAGERIFVVTCLPWSQLIPNKKEPRAQCSGLSTWEWGRRGQSPPSGRQVQRHPPQTLDPGPWPLPPAQNCRQNNTDV